MGFYQFKSSQYFNNSLDELWEFISNPRNLKTITPDYMGFDIQTEDLPEKMYEGMIIKYKVSPALGIKTTWVTEITHVKHQHYFVDEQRMGPYKVWHHEHFLEPAGTGTIMRDIVSYQPPFGILGNLANTILIKRKLNEIFDYRSMALKERFPQE
ncbi:SRPBCC family protein [Saccharicrinis aurantiacus]|uniref:SRPBCC family protein n=1 Tax=Saccharicrinis aurantiacus TaxID=1849719 RepID=UPI00094F7EAB|nr:SRPBCC family protein [Saccharicrinis aurantiacus]